MGAYFQEDFAVSNDCDAAAFGNFLFAIDYVNLTAFSQSCQQIRLVYDNLLSGNNESFSFDLGR